MRSLPRASLFVCVVAATLAVAPAFAQYGGGGSGGMPTGGSSSTGGGYGSSNAAAIGAGAGAAAAVAALVVYLHFHGRVQGCVEPQGQGLRLVDEKHDKIYTLDPGSLTLKLGEEVILKGKKEKSGSGNSALLAKKLIKDIGSCKADVAPPGAGAR